MSPCLRVGAAILLWFAPTAGIEAQVSLTGGGLQVGVSRQGAVTSLRNTASGTEYVHH